MWYIIIAGFLIIGALFGARKLSCNTSAQSNDRDSLINLNTTDIENDTIKAMFSKQQIDIKLKRLAETPPPEKLATGAMCYKVAFERVMVYEYICPFCGEKTIYKKDENEHLYIGSFQKNIEKCRREVAKVKGINIKLDESLLCKHCSPKAENPSICLLVNIAGQSDTTRVCNIEYNDIQLINEFLNDKLAHSDDYDFETPLVNNISRIKQLLGL